jgi:deoxyribose-phosphate aldolase
MKEILTKIDLAVLKATTTPGTVLEAAEAVKYYNFATVCVFPKHVEVARTILPPEKISAVVGFPLSPTPLTIKLKEAVYSIEKGAGELDVVVDISAVKCGDWNRVEEELREIRKEIPLAVLKLIFECCYLTEEEKITLCRLAVENGWDYLKTSTGYGSYGATFEDVELLVKCANGRAKVKAAGGIRTLEDVKKFISLGAERIGTSNGKEIAKQVLHSGEI